jgi:hypothetical protein
MTQVIAKAAPTLRAKRQRSLQFSGSCRTTSLIFTESSSDPTLRELRSFITGYLRRDFQAFRDSFERLRTSASEQLAKDKTFRNALTLFGAIPTRDSRSRC